MWCNLRGTIFVMLAMLCYLCDVSYVAHAIYAVQSMRYNLCGAIHCIHLMASILPCSSKHPTLPPATWLAKLKWPCVQAPVGN